jgi:hypothetical protein
MAHRENHAWSIEYSGLILDVVTGHYWVYRVKSREEPRPSRGPDTMASLEEHRQMSTEYELDVGHKQELARLLEGGVCQGNKSEHRAFDAGTLSVFAVWPYGSLLIGRVGNTRVVPHDEGRTTRVKSACFIMWSVCCAHTRARAFRHSSIFRSPCWPGSQ